MPPVLESLWNVNTGYNQTLAADCVSREYWVHLFIELMMMIWPEEIYHRKYTRLTCIFCSTQQQLPCLNHSINICWLTEDDWSWTLVRHPLKSWKPQASLGLLYQTWQRLFWNPFPLPSPPLWVRDLFPLKLIKHYFTKLCFHLRKKTVMPKLFYCEKGRKP